MSNKFKLTKAQAEVLKAYRDDTFHNHPRASQSVIERNLLTWEGPAIGGQFVISMSGLRALEAYEAGQWQHK